MAKINKTKNKMYVIQDVNTKEYYCTCVGIKDSFDSEVFRADAFSDKECAKYPMFHSDKNAFKGRTIEIKKIYKFK